MKRLAALADQPNAKDLVGGTLALDARHPRRRSEVLLRKGRVITAAGLERLAESGPVSLVVLLPEDELGEDEAAVRLGQALAGPGVDVSSPHQGVVLLRGQYRGLYRLDRDVIAAANTEAGVLAITAPGERPTDAGMVLAEVKVAPLFLPETAVRNVEALRATRGPAVWVQRVPERRVALVGTQRLSAAARAQAEDSITGRVGWYGSQVEAAWPPAEREELAQAFRRAAAEADVVLVATTATMDPEDVVYAALRDAGGTVARAGIPIEPGTACWHGTLGAKVVFGLASCELFGSPGAFDVVLPWLLAGNADLDRVILDHAVGGLLLDGPPLVPDYAASSPGHEVGAAAS